MADTKPYDRTDLGQVLAEYARQATLPTVILSPEVFKDAAYKKIEEDRSEGRVY